ncbi:hypothetical protein [Enterococcus raffinosus]|nr:hypothetical protein [Enterococcus raffinosus]OJG84051.1 hypothetical protein RV13_GL002513 [Enterococcus raffinosus]QZO07748.1 hypothetical protein K5P74_07410 [Enterococcus raffinosus]
MLLNITHFIFYRFLANAAYGVHLYQNTQTNLFASYSQVLAMIIILM